MMSSIDCEYIVFKFNFYLDKCHNNYIFYYYYYYYYYYLVYMFIKFSTKYILDV